MAKASTKAAHKAASIKPAQKPPQGSLADAFVDADVKALAFMVERCEKAAIGFAITRSDIQSDLAIGQDGYEDLVENIMDLARCDAHAEMSIEVCIDAAMRFLGESEVGPARKLAYARYLGASLIEAVEIDISQTGQAGPAVRLG
ncbi:MAG TPA: hypothetical protein VIM34_06805 [Burkholderiaceae bacterium]